LKRILLAIIIILAASPALAQSLNDQVVLANDALFNARVRMSLISAAINISSDGLTTGIHIKRHAQAQAIMTNAPTAAFAAAIATQPAVIGAATASGTVVLKPMVCNNPPQTGCTETGNVDTQQALVSDAVINTNVAAVYNSFFGGQ
jgi:hypothetical protein